MISKEDIIKLLRENRFIDKRFSSLTSDEISKLSFSKLDWDRLDVIEAIMILEESFEIEISDDELENCQTLKDLIDLTLSKTKEESEKEWKPIETAPKDGKCILWVSFDGECKQTMLERNSKGEWLYEGEPLYCHSFNIEPLLWTECPDDPV